MAVWDEIKDILASIDSKLGDNSAKRAGILDNVVPKKDKSEDAKLQSLENTLQKAFSKIPILNQLMPAIQGFSSILRDLLAMRGLFVGLKDFGNIFSHVKGIGKSKSAIFSGIVDKLAKTDGAAGWSKKDISKSLMQLFGRTFLKGTFGGDLEDGFKWGQKRWGETIAKRFPGLAKLSGVGGVAGAGMNLGKAFKSLLAPLAASAGTIAATIAGVIAAVVAAVVVATAAVVGFAKHLVFAKRGLAKLNAQYAIAFAMFDIRKMFRDMRSAAKTSAVSQKFLTVWGDFLDKIQPVLDDLFNIFVKLGIGTLKFVNKLIDAAPTMKEAADAVAAGPLWQLAEYLGLPSPTEIGAWALDAWSGVDQTDENKNQAIIDAHDGKITSLMEKANRAMDLIIKAHEEDLEAAVPVSAAAFMAGVAGAGYESNTVRDMNLRPDLDVIWKRHAELK